MSKTGTEHFNLKEADGLPEFVKRGDRDADGFGWDYYECPACGEVICSFCDCPNDDCRWYDGDDWNEAIRRAAREREDIYSGSLEVDA